MIHVKVDRNTTGSIRSFTVSGHALFAKAGKDIVCAGVSSVTVGTVNSVEALTDVSLMIDQIEEGLLKVSVPFVASNDTADKVQLLLESMVVMLKTIEDEYGEFITLGNITH